MIGEKIYPVKIFCTRGSEEITGEICRRFKNRLREEERPAGIAVNSVQEFSNENIEVQVENVRGYFVVVVHTQVSPVNNRLVELFALLDAITNARPEDVLLVFPYMPYARSDRKNKPRISVLGELIPHIISDIIGVQRVILLDPHDSHVKHYFHPTADEISSLYLLASHVEKNVFSKASKENCVIVFADAGAAKRFEQFTHLLKLPAAYIDKNRPDDSEKPACNKIVGDVKDKVAIFIDDEILSGNTAVEDAKLIKEGGAKDIVMCAPHAILSDKTLSKENLIKKLEDSPISSFIITDSVPVREKITLSKKFTCVSVADLLAEAIARTIKNQSLTDLHEYSNVKFYNNN